MRGLYAKSSALLGLTVFSAVVIVTLWYAPRYLICENSLRKTDCIILLVGPDYDLRRDKALELMADGYSSNLVMPAFNSILVSSEKEINPPHWQPEEESPFIDAMKIKDKFRFYENTHLEVLIAKEISERHGFRSITFVSSPYHMRRVKLIAERVFAANYYRLSFVTYGTRNPNSFLWIFREEDLKWVTSEYVKIVWFMVYTSLS